MTVDRSFIFDVDVGAAITQFGNTVEALVVPGSFDMSYFDDLSSKRITELRWGKTRLKISKDPQIRSKLKMRFSHKMFAGDFVDRTYTVFIGLFDGGHVTPVDYFYLRKDRSAIYDTSPSLVLRPAFCKHVKISRKDLPEGVAANLTVRAGVALEDVRIAFDVSYGHKRDYNFLRLVQHLDEHGDEIASGQPKEIPNGELLIKKAWAEKSSWARIFVTLCYKDESGVVVRTYETKQYDVFFPLQKKSLQIVSPIDTRTGASVGTLPLTSVELRADGDAALLNSVRWYVVEGDPSLSYQDVEKLDRGEAVAPLGYNGYQWDGDYTGYFTSEIPAFFTLIAVAENVKTHKLYYDSVVLNDPVGALPLGHLTLAKTPDEYLFGPVRLTAEDYEFDSLKNSFTAK